MSEIIAQVGEVSVPEKAEQSCRVQSLMTRVNRWTVYVAASILTIMTVMIVLDVSLRFLFDAPLPASVEASELMIPYVVFLPFAFTLAKGGHVRVTLLTDRLPAKLTAVIDIVAHLFLVGFLLTLTYFSFLEFQHSYAIGETMLAAIRLPWWVGKAAMPIGLFLVAVQGIVAIVQTARKLCT